MVHTRSKKAKIYETTRHAKASIAQLRSKCISDHNLQLKSPNSNWNPLISCGGAKFLQSIPNFIFLQTTLSRREQQALYKRNMISANITNVIMVDALATLPSVEGIKEFLNSKRSRVPEFPMKAQVSLEIPRTALITLTKRKVVEDETITTAITTQTRSAAEARGTGE